MQQATVSSSVSLVSLGLVDPGIYLIRGYALVLFSGAASDTDWGVRIFAEPEGDMIRLGGDPQLLEWDDTSLPPLARHAVGFESTVLVKRPGIMYLWGLAEGSGSPDPATVGWDAICLFDVTKIA